MDTSMYTHTHLHTHLPTGVERGVQRNEKWVKQTEKYPQRREDLEKIHIISPKRKMHLQMRAFDDDSWINLSKTHGYWKYRELGSQSWLSHTEGLGGRRQGRGGGGQKSRCRPDWDELLMDRDLWKHGGSRSGRWFNSGELLECLYFKILNEIFKELLGWTWKAKDSKGRWIGVHWYSHFQRG